VSDWKLIPNPAWEGKLSRPLGRIATCHDGTAFLTVQCQCGGQMHLHYSQVEPLPEKAVIVTACLDCREELVMERDWLLGAMREAWQL